MKRKRSVYKPESVAHVSDGSVNDLSKNSRKNSPIVISFYSGDQYYYDAADRLRADCAALGLESDIIEIKKLPEETWLDLCRRKIPFYLQMQRKHKRPILWIDVDCRILRRPYFLENLSCDLALYLRNFKYIRGFDPMAFARFIQPSILLFNYTPRTCAFLELMAKLEEESKLPGSDDYYLQEAWEKFEEQLSLLLLPPETVSFKFPALGEATFYFGESGNVKEFRGQAEQHKVNLFTPARRKAVFLHEAAELGKQKKAKEAFRMLRSAFQIDRSDEILAYRMARWLRRNGKLKAALNFLSRFEGSDSKANHARRFLADSELEAGNIEKADKLVSQLLQSESETDKAWAGSRMLRIGLEKRAAECNLKPEQRPAIWWMESPHPGNFGDILNPYIIEKLCGKPPRLAPKDKGILAIGSIIKFATAGSVVWGSGTPRMSDRLNPNADYRAVRGPLTRQLVLDSGGKCPEVYGDVAWFLPRLYKAKPPACRYKLGLIRHFANDEDISAGEGVKIISVIRAGYEGIHEFIDELHECECILTTSLHGLIVSHAYGIPARWCEVPDSSVGLPGDGTKFYDYLLSVGMPTEPPLALPRGSIIDISLAKDAQRLPAKQLDLEALSAAAPFEIVYPWRDS